ncbi:MAG TPA: hypothetical protein VKR24_08800 [Candidatus Limnocylindrales bacterium]|nr:hypothetical protein [Candidatus Limnocylindrales bacterium]
MIEIIGRTLRLAFRSAGDEPAEPVLPAYTAIQPEIEFSAYSEDSRISGLLRLDGERLTDMLNAFEQFVLVDAMVEDLAGGGAVEVDELILTRDELVAVEASGPRGNPDRRVRVRPFPIGAKLGHYLVRGYVHVTPGADPVLAVRRKRPIVPLTDATIEYNGAHGRVQRRSSTILFNRELADWILPTVDEAIEYPDMPIAKNQGRLTKDFTGLILGDWETRTSMP